MAGIEFDASLVERSKISSSVLGIFLKAIGSLLSLFLIVGLLYWGYNLSLKSRIEMPIIKSQSGPLKVIPDDPGGELALHLGFSVNSVQENGHVAGPSSKIVLAPPSVGVQDSDLRSLSGFGDSNGQIDLKSTINSALANVFSNVTELGKEQTLEPQTLRIKESVSSRPNNLRVLLRPERRPEKADLNFSYQDSIVQILLNEVKANSLSDPRGKLMVHLGSFENSLVASAQVENFVTLYKDYLSNKTVFVQKSETGGRFIYRIRAIGFESTRETDKFCTLINSFGNDCIPVLSKESL